MENKKQTALTVSVTALLAALFIWRALVGEASLMGMFVGASLLVLFVFCLIPFLAAAWEGFTREDSLSPDALLGARSLRRERRHPWAQIVMFMLLTRLFLYVAAYLLYSLAREAFPGGLLDTLQTVWLRSDAPHYLGISERWYVTVGDPRFHIVFFPFYPIVTAMFHPLTGNSFASALIVSNLGAIGAAILAYEVAALDCKRQDALRAMKYMFIMPAAFFFAAPMSESLFLLLSLSCVYLVRKKRYLLGCLFGALAGFTRSLGGLLLVFIAFEWLADVLAERRAGTLRAHAKTHVLRALSMLIVPLGLVGYLLINYAVTGDAFTFMRYQSEHWGQGFGFFFESAATQVEYLVYALNNGEISKALGLWIPNLTYTFASLAIMTGAAKRLRPSYTAFFLVYFVVACGTTWLLSAPRYLSAAFPLPFALALLTDTKKKDGIATALCLLLLVAYLFAFANGLYVY